MALKLKDSPRNISVLFALGIVLLAYGLGASYVEGSVSRLNAALAILGAASLLICFVRVRSLLPKTFSSSRWKKYALFIVLIVLWSVLFVEINFFAYRHNVRWDLTKAQQHTLTQTTQDLIEGLGQEVRLTAFHVGIPPKYLEDLFREYARVSSGKIVTEIIDPIVQIGYAAQFGNVISGREKKVFVQSGKEQREIDFTERALSEEQLTNAIVRVTRKIRRAYFLIGHNEYNIYEDGDEGLKVFEAMLLTNNVISQRLMLGIKGAIPEDCDVLIVAGAKSHLTQKEEEIIQAYLKDGGDALFLIEQVAVTTPDNPLTEEQKTKNPSLNSILNDWGINIADDIVVDLSSHASGDIGSPATRNYMAHKSIVRDLDYTFFVRPRSISIKRGRRPSVRVAPLILTASDEDSWGETNRTLQVKFDAGVDRSGPVPIAFAIWEPREEGEASDTRIIVITDADFLTNVFIGQYSNARLGLNAVSWLSDSDYRVLIGKKDIDVERLDLTSKQKRMVGVILFLMPVFIAVAGIMVWIKQHIS
ncbi:MAG: GldG family protein [Candidatus Omnitrophica bacterium]|nr:GldG family protein [Candidatus Omnitrophota bacterium]